MILTLDIATISGWCHGRAGSTPVYGTLDLRGRGDTGGAIARLRPWLAELLTTIEPQLVCFEAPYLPRGRKGDVFPQNVHTTRRLYGLVGTVEAICYERNIRCLEANAPEIAKFFLGPSAPMKRAAKKLATIARCQALGFHVADDNQADALALFFMAEEKLCPGIRRASLGPLFATKVDTPRMGPRGASGGLPKPHSRLGVGTCTAAR